jgi:hypothetical protein
MAEKKTVSAREVVQDIKVGMTDEQLMLKHGLSAKGLQSLKTKLVTAGLLTAQEHNGQSPPTQVADPSVDKRVFAKNIADTVKNGVPDAEIIKRFGISAAKLPKVYESLVKGGYLTQEDLNRRGNGEAFEETVDLSLDSLSLPSDSSIPRKPLSVNPHQNQLPIFKWLCPSCKTPHSQEYPVCPQCGIIVEKYNEKVTRTQQAKEATPEAPPQQTVRNDLPTPPSSAQPDPASGITPATEVSSEFSKKMAQLKDARDQGILSQAEFEKKNSELALQAKHSEAQDKLKGLLDAGIITQEEFEAKKADPFQYQSKLEKLQEALASGVLSQTEFDQKKRELLGIPSASDSQSKKAIPPSIHESSREDRYSPSIKNPLGSAIGSHNGLRIGGGLLAIISGLFGTGAAITTLFFGGMGAAFGGEGAGFIIFLGWFGLFASFLTIVAGAISIGVNNRVPALILIISAALGSILGGRLVEICMILAQVAGILILFGLSRSPEATSGSGVNAEPIDEYYNDIFKSIEAGNRPKFNWYACIGTWIWYLVKHMTEKAFVYLAAGCILFDVIGFILPATLSMGVGFAIAGFYGSIANWDYYLYKVHGQTFFTKHWLAGLSTKFEFPNDLVRE